jgi:ADP-ribosyl-[dinitrogen reductase] hydrolase
MGDETNKDRVVGMFLGIAIGDALFMPVETFSAVKIEGRYGRIKSYLPVPGDHKWFAGRPAGTWTDDTQLTLVVADSLIEKGQIDMNDMAARHVKSLEREGDQGFGASTRSAIKRLASGIHWSGSGISTNPKHGYGNGLPMKVAPLGAYSCSPVFENDTKSKKLLVQDIINLALMTHYREMAVQSALAHVSAIRYCLLSSPSDFLTGEFIGQVCEAASLAHSMEDLISNPTKDDLIRRLSSLKNIDLAITISKKIINRFGAGSCYVFDSLPFSYAFFLRNPKSIETLYDVGNAGGDTDTNASIVGGMLGALNGSSIFPTHLMEGLQQKNRILQTAERFCERFGII